MQTQLAGYDYHIEVDDGEGGLLRKMGGVANFGFYPAEQFDQERSHRAGTRVVETIQQEKEMDDAGTTAGGDRYSPHE
jgi:hypothetical protein